MGEVTCMPHGNVSSRALLQEIIGNEFISLVVVGIDETGAFYCAGTSTKIDELNLLLDLAKRYLLDEQAAHIPGADYYDV